MSVTASFCVNFDLKGFAWFNSLQSESYYYLKKDISNKSFLISIMKENIWCTFPSFDCLYYIGDDGKHSSDLLTALSNIFSPLLEVYFPIKLLFPNVSYLLTHYIYLKLKANLSWSELKQKICCDIFFSLN